MKRSIDQLRGAARPWETAREAATTEIGLRVCGVEHHRDEAGAELVPACLLRLAVGAHARAREGARRLCSHCMHTLPKDCVSSCIRIRAHEW